MINWSVVIVVAQFMLGIVVIVAAYLSTRTTMNKAANEVQGRVREALMDENKILRERVEHLETAMELLKSILKKRGMTVEIGMDGAVEVTDNSGSRVVVKRKQRDDDDSNS